MNALTPIEVADAHNMPAAIAEAIGKIMASVKNVEKHGENKFHNYKFARVEDLMFQVQPAMVEAGLVITQDEVRHEIVSDTLMLATYAFSLSHASGVTWGPIHQTGMAGLKNTKGGYDDKALNKCHTAARKYFILGLFQVPAGDLPDADNEGDVPAPKRGQAGGKPPAQDEGPDAADAAINVLETFSDTKEQFTETWTKNKAPWKELMTPEQYARVVAAMKRIAGKFTAPPAPPPPPPPKTAENDLGIGDDMIPF